MTTAQPRHTSPEQLSLLAVSELPLQFRLDQRTRQRGLAHIAAIRSQLESRSGATQDAHHADRAA
jgi:hypothetical protein